jgi:hypothetical protein
MAFTRRRHTKTYTKTQRCKPPCLLSPKAEEEFSVLTVTHSRGRILRAYCHPKICCNEYDCRVPDGYLFRGLNFRPGHLAVRLHSVTPPFLCRCSHLPHTCVGAYISLHLKSLPPPKSGIDAHICHTHMSVLMSVCLHPQSLPHTYPL